MNRLNMLDVLLLIINMPDGYVIIVTYICNFKQGEMGRSVEMN